MQNIKIADSFTSTTVVGSMLNLSQLTGTAIPSLREFTLNTKYNVYPTATLKEPPKLKYFGIGINGIYHADDTKLNAAYPTRKENLDLYDHIPFRCRPIDDDLSDLERKAYRMRVVSTIKGKTYASYYLKLIEWTNDIKTVIVNNSNNTTTPFELNGENLNPKPRKPDSNDNIVSNASNIATFLDGELRIEGKELKEFINLMYEGDLRYAVVSELGLYSGLDFEANGTTATATTIKYTEAAGVTLHTHQTHMGIPLTKENDILKKTIRLSANGIYFLD